MSATRKQPWPLVAALVAALAFLWPPDGGRSLAAKTINWVADPQQALPRRPSPIAIGVDDDADVVSAHDAEEHAYEAMWGRSWMARTRLRMRDAEDPLDPATERPLLVALAAIAAAWGFRRESSRQSQSQSQSQPEH